MKPWIVGAAGVLVLGASCRSLAVSTPHETLPAVRTPQVLQPGCITDGSPAIADSLRMGCEQARARFERLLARPAMPTTVLEVDSFATSGELRNGRLVMKLGNQGALDAVQAEAGGVVRHGVGHVVAHELGHGYLAAYLHGGPDTIGPYATFLPDWIDEGVAIWHEFADDRRDRALAAAELPDGDFDLIGFASRRHPSLGAPRVRRSHVAEFRDFEPRIPECVRDPVRCDPDFGGRHVRILTWIDTLAVLHVDTVFEGDPRFGWFQGGNYSALAATLIAFLHDAGGPALIREVIRRAAAGMPPAELFTGLPRLPTQPSDVNRAWIRFVRSPAPPRSRPEEARPALLHRAFARVCGEGLGLHDRASCGRIAGRAARLPFDPE